MSLVSRAAGMRGLSAAALCDELGLSFKKIVGNDGSQNWRIQELFGLDEEAFREVQSWSLTPMVGVRVHFRGEPYISRAIMNPTVRGCPACLRDAVSSSQTPPQGQMAMQGHWQLKYVEKCLLHEVELVPLWTVRSPLQRYDYAARLRSLSGDVMRGALPQQSARITSCDRWLDDRLGGAPDTTWLAAHDIEVAATLCTLLGDELGKVRLVLPAPEVSTREIGFEVSRKGPDAIHDALIEMASSASGAQDGPQKAFGQLYRWLNQYVAQDERYNVFRDLMRQVILETWAVPAGENVLGAVVSTRRLHSIASASSEIGRSKKVTRQILEHTNIVASEDDRTDKRLTFDAEHACPTLEVAKRLVMTKAMIDYLGASAGQFDVLVEQGVLKPALPPSVSKIHWDPADADDLLSQMTRDAIDIEKKDAAWVEIGVAAGRARVLVKDAIAAVIGGKIQVGIRDGQRSYSAICVRQSDMDSLSAKRPEYPTLAEFGVEVGLHKDGSIHALYDAGQVKAITLFNPETRRTGLYMTDEAQQDFHKRFTTLKLLSSDLHIEPRVLARILREVGISPYSLEGMLLPKVYLRADTVNLWEALLDRRE